MAKAFQTYRFIHIMQNNLHVKRIICTFANKLQKEDGTDNKQFEREAQQ